MARSHEQHEQDDVAAVFPSVAQARSAIAELGRRGLAAEHLDAAARAGDARVYELRFGRETLRSVARGIAVGAPAGAVAGTCFVALAVALGHNPLPWGAAHATLGLLDAFEAGGIPGLLGGLLFGGFAGVFAADWLSREQDRWEAVPLAETDVLVVARAHGSRAVVQEVLERHGGMAARAAGALPSDVRPDPPATAPPSDAAQSAPARRSGASPGSAAVAGAALVLGVQAVLVVSRGWRLFIAGARADEVLGTAAFATMDRDVLIGTLLMVLGVAVAITALLLVLRWRGAWFLALGFQVLWPLNATVTASAGPLADGSSAVLAVAAVLLLLHSRPRVTAGWRSTDA